MLKKLSSNLKEIRQRTLKTYIFKLKTFHLDAEELMETNLTIKLLSMLGEDKEMDLDIFNIFSYFIKQQRGRQLLSSLGLEILREYLVKNPGNDQVIEILKKIKHSDEPEPALLDRDIPLKEDEFQEQASELLVQDEKQIDSRYRIALSDPNSAAKVLLFDHVNVQPIQEEQLMSWVNLLCGIPIVEKIEVDLFDEICSTIGPQIFLQRSELLKKILEGIDSNDQLR
jgi:hypothetical protein